MEEEIVLQKDDRFREKSNFGGILDTDTLNANEAAQGPPDNKYDRRRKIGASMNVLSHLIFVIFTIYIIYLCFEDYSLFSWHPTCMTIGSLLLMTEAVMIMSKNNIIASKLGRQGRVRMHWILQASAAAFIFAGFVIIVVNKNKHNKKHFQSWHSIIGLVFLISVGITSSGGVVTLYSFRLKQFLKPAKIKLLHNLFGILTFVIGVVTEIFGIYTAWFPKRASFAAQVVCTVFVVLAGIFALEAAVKSAYSRFKALYQSS